ncbi:XdhC family protein [Clostridium tagluense]|uniref:XdhC family protein n=1 Tax=Clostridium tagluense TaxID=360422 RepID=UPI001CF31BBB|nr:XdhC/CoxI family protein [Clostridium tagluense]MCB2297507.1 XdhC/CoxI family protein [Clostridium tagluense]
MELELLSIIKNELMEDKKICYAFIIEQEGATPRGVGTSMVIKENGETFGTVGGGKVELTAIAAAKKCIKEETSESISSDVYVYDNGEKICTGKVKVFIKTYMPQKKLIIAGAGHVAHCLYKLATLVGFSVYVFDDREELLTKEKYPNATRLIHGKISDTIKDYDLDKNSYVVITSGSHKSDEDILKEVITKNTAYVGMLGSKKKISTIMDNLLSQNIDAEFLKKVYAPIGIAIGGETPEEVALSILSEIVLVKNKGSLQHLKS